MRLVIQRVSSASVSVGGNLISSIGPGLCVLVGISKDDTEKDAEYMCRKLLTVRLFNSASPTDTGDGTVAAGEVPNRWACSVTSKRFELLCVSQFTLYGQLKGNKPDFRCAMTPSEARRFYDDFLQKLRSAYEPEKIKVFPDCFKVATVIPLYKGGGSTDIDGVFAEMMQVSLVNDGPVTLTLESPHSASKEMIGRKE